MVIKRIHKSDSVYPASLKRFLPEDAPESAATLGNFQLLSYPKLAIFCSGACPAAIVSQAEQVMRKVMDAGITVISGFHSEFEKQCVKMLVRGDQPIIISPARSLDKLRIRPEYKKALENGRLLFLSFFRSHRHRSDREMAFKRNLYVAALAERILIVHAAPSSKTEQLCRELLRWQKPVYTICDKDNQNLARLRAQMISGGTSGELIDGLAKIDRS